MKQNTEAAADESNMQFKISIKHFELIFDGGKRADDLGNLKIVLMMKEMFAEVNIGNDGRDMEVKFGVQNLELIDDQLDGDNVFEKILFWNKLASDQESQQMSTVISMKSRDNHDPRYGYI